MLEDLIRAWQTNNRINLFLIDKISREGMVCTLSKRGGRDVARQFAHMHNNRVWHLEKRARDLSDGLKTFERKVSPSKLELRKALKASSFAIERFMGDLVARKPMRRGFKKGVSSVLAYFVAHESHHRGSILLTLKVCGQLPGKDVVYAIWDWDKI